MTAIELAERHKDLLMQLMLRGLIPCAEVPEQVWSNLEATGLLERTISKYLRLTVHGHTVLDQDWMEAEIARAR